MKLLRKVHLYIYMTIGPLVSIVDSVKDRRNIKVLAVGWWLAFLFGVLLMFGVVNFLPSDIGATIINGATSFTVSLIVLAFMLASLYTTLTLATVPPRVLKSYEEANFASSAVHAYFLPDGLYSDRYTYTTAGQHKHEIVIAHGSEGFELSLDGVNETGLSRSEIISRAIEIIESEPY